jgi:hypothetical protein
MREENSNKPLKGFGNMEWRKFRFPLKTSDLPFIEYGYKFFGVWAPNYTWISEQISCQVVKVKVGKGITIFFQTMRN